jgi:hypothetical protein
MRPVGWQLPLWDFHIQFTSCSSVPSGKKHHHPKSCVFAWLETGQHKQRFKSKFAVGSAPIWKGRHVFAVGDVQHDVVTVRLLLQDEVKGEVRVGTAKIPLADFTPMAAYDVRNYRIQPADGARDVGTLQVKAGVRKVLPAKVSNVTLPKRPKGATKSAARGHSRAGFDHLLDSSMLYTSQDGSGRRQIEPDVFLATQDAPRPRRVKPSAISASDRHPRRTQPDPVPASQADSVLRPLGLNFSIDRLPAGGRREVVESRPAWLGKTVDVGDFNWGDCGSEFSTDFTGYSGKGGSLSDGPIADGESGAGERIIVRKHFLKGKVIGANGLGDGLKFLVVDLIGRKRPKGKREVSEAFAAGDKNDIALSFDFGEVKKGWTVEIAAGIKHAGGNEKIGVARIPIKDIEVDAPEPVIIHLPDPEKGESHRGDLQVELKHHLN